MLRARSSWRKHYIRKVFTIKAIEICSLPITDSRLFLSVTPNTVLSRSSSEGKGSTLFTLGDWKCIHITNCSYYFILLTTKTLHKLYRLCAAHSFFSGSRKEACQCISKFIYFNSSPLVFKNKFQYVLLYKSQQ